MKKFQRSAFDLPQDVHNLRTHCWLDPIQREIGMDSHVIEANRPTGPHAPLRAISDEDTEGISMLRPKLNRGPPKQRRP